MNFKQMQYAVMLAETCSFSQLAEKLGVSQPALSKQIINLESELGIRLFNRDTIPLTLTPAGEFYVQEARALLHKEEHLTRAMEMFKSGKAGRLTIGISPFRSAYLIPEILRKVKDKYPHVRISIWEDTSDALRHDAAAEKYDFAVVNLPVDDTVLDVVPLEPDMLVLAVPNKLIGRIKGQVGGNFSTIELKNCKELPFVAVSQMQELRKLFDRLCAAADFYPDIVAEVKGGLTTARALAAEGLGATLLPLRILKEEQANNRLTLFKLKEKAISRQPVVVTKKGRYLPDYVKYAISLLTE